MRKWKYLFLHCCDVCSNILPLLSCIPSRRSITTCWQRKSTRFKRNWRKRGGHDSRSRAWCQANLALPPQASHRVLRAWGSRPWPQGNPQVSKHTVLPPSHTSLNVHRCTWRHAQNCCRIEKNLTARLLDQWHSYCLVCIYIYDTKRWSKTTTTSAHTTCLICLNMMTFVHPNLQYFSPFKSGVSRSKIDGNELSITIKRN